MSKDLNLLFFISVKILLVSEEQQTFSVGLELAQ